MYNSIQQFQLNGVKSLEKVFGDYAGDTKKIAEMVRGVTAVVTQLGLSMIAEEWESYDKLLCERSDLRKGWHIVKKDESTLTTSLGDVVYHKTLFRHKETGEYCYLLDQLIGIEKHARMTEDACARMLEEAVESSYRKGGSKASITGNGFSKETVMAKLHSLEFPEIIHKGKKKQVKKIYIDADEDHVSLQYLEKKGDIKKPRNNTVMPRIIYVYEGIDTEESGRPRLVNPKYFGGVYDGSDAVKGLWDTILGLLDERGSITISEIKDILKVSESTARRDIVALDKLGKLEKVFGGAIAVNEKVTTQEPSVLQKADLHKEEKRKIAEYAAGLIGESDFVFIDSGTSTYELVKLISASNGMTFVTNGIAHAQVLAAKGKKVILIGGEIKNVTEAIVGNSAIMMIQKFHFSKGFFGANGISKRSDLTTPEYSEALFKQEAMRHCKERYVLCDSSKFGVVTSVTFGRISDSVIITEKAPDDYRDYKNIISVE